MFCKANWWWWKQKQHTTMQRTLSHHSPLWNVRFQNIGHSLFIFCFVFSWTEQTNFQLPWCVCKNMYNQISLLRHSHAWWLCGWTFILITKYYFLTRNSFESWSWALHKLIDYWSYILGLCWTKTTNKYLVCLTFSKLTQNFSVLNPSSTNFVYYNKINKMKR